MHTNVTVNNFKFFSSIVSIVLFFSYRFSTFLYLCLMIFLLGNTLVLFHVLALVVDHLDSQGTVCTVMVVHKLLFIYLFMYLFEVYFRIVTSG